MREFLEIRSGWSEDSFLRDVIAAGPLVVRACSLPAVATMQNNENKCVH